MSILTGLARHSDIEQWMSLVNIVKESFPGLDQEEYRKILESCIENQEAICTKEQGQIVGILLFSVEHSILAFMAVHPEFRKRGIAAAMIEYMISLFPSGSAIWVTTYRENDPQGAAARGLYLKCGFEADELVMEMDYPCQKFVLHRQ